MTIVVTEISLPSDSFELGRILHDGPDMRVELTQFVPTGSSLIPYFWVETNELDAFEESVRADDRVASLTKLDGRHDKSLYRIEWAGELDGFLATVADHNLLIEEGTGTADQWRFHLRGPDRENLSSFQRTLREQDIPAEIRRVWNPGDPETDPYGLTAEQREALELAFTEGYFDVPRTTNLTALGDHFDITPQSVSRRITRGLHRLLAATLMQE